MNSPLRATGRGLRSFLWLLAAFAWLPAPAGAGVIDSPSLLGPTVAAGPVRVLPGQDGKAAFLLPAVQGAREFGSRTKAFLAETIVLGPTPGAVTVFQQPVILTVGGPEVALRFAYTLNGTFVEDDGKQPQISSLGGGPLDVAFVLTGRAGVAEPTGTLQVDFPRPAPIRTGDQLILPVCQGPPTVVSLTNVPVFSAVRTRQTGGPVTMTPGDACTQTSYVVIPLPLVGGSWRLALEDAVTGQTIAQTSGPVQPGGETLTLSYRLDGTLSTNGQLVNRPTTQGPLDILAVVDSVLQPGALEPIATLQLLQPSGVFSNGTTGRLYTAATVKLSHLHVDRSTHNKD